MKVYLYDSPNEPKAITGDIPARVFDSKTAIIAELDRAAAGLNWHKDRDYGIGNTIDRTALVPLRAVNRNNGQVLIFA